ncbi:hypothetical protein HMPREF0262_01354 [Clostridium sp. ATCC 29733]|nr:hypothetical protein HMPREF0262_01354 [Clostridium sp. ATCC 29733]
MPPICWSSCSLSILFPPPLARTSLPPLYPPLPLSTRGRFLKKETAGFGGAVSLMGPTLYL